MAKKSFEDLLIGFEENLLTQEELSQFLILVQKEEFSVIFKTRIEKAFNNDTVTHVDRDREDQLYRQVLAVVKTETNNKEPVITFEKKSRIIPFIRIAAASLVIVICVLLWSTKSDKRDLVKNESKKELYKNDILPGGDKAILTLPDGTAIELDDAKNGNVVQQGNTNVIKTGGKIVYSVADKQSKDQVYNTITTPKGGQFQIELSDGTQVWLNAASSIYFPTSFSGKERRVQITGEVYFEVAKNSALPFMVSVSDAEIQVLGTHFNVMAYKEENILKTTLLEGSVKFIGGNTSIRLKPGQQSQLLPNKQTKVINGVDLEEVVAWKNGLFQFESSDIETVLRQLARWYDVEVIFKGKKVSDPFHVEIPRKTNLSDVLKALELSGGARFNIQGKRIVVMQ